MHQNPKSALAKAFYFPLFKLYQNLNFFKLTKGAPHKGPTPQECPTRVSHTHKSVLQECPTRVSRKSVLQERRKSDPQEIPKSAPKECSARVSYKGDPQECPTRVSHKSVLQECPTRVSYKSDPEECHTRVSYKSVVWTYVALRTCLQSGSWAPSCFYEHGIS